MGGLAIATGTGIGHLARPTAWWNEAAVLDADFANARFRWDGQSFADETAFLTAIGGTKTGIRRVIGPYALPGAPELLGNTDFSTLSGWTSVLNGASTVSIVSGTAQFNSDGATGTGAGGAGVTADAVTEADTPYALEVQTPAINGSASMRFGSSLYGSEGGSWGTMSANTLWRFPVTGRTTASRLYLYRASSGSANVDRVSLRKATAFKGFAQGGFTAEISARAPAAVAANKYLACFHGCASDRVLVFVDTSFQLVVRVTYAAVDQCFLVLGTVAAGADFTLRFSVKANEFVGKLNTAGAVATDFIGTMPPIGRLSLGQDWDGTSTWDGDIYRVTLTNGGGFGQFVGGTDLVYLDGDSFGEPNTVMSIAAPLATATGRTVYSTGLSGSTMDAIGARLAAKPAEMKARPTVVWDGDQNGITTVAAYCDLLAAGLAGYSRFVIIPPCVNFGQVDASQEIAIRDEMLARWPNNLLDWRSVLPMAGNAPTSAMFNNPGTDTTHLNATAQGLMATAVKAFLKARGW